jgi:rare lipoprotein A
VGAPCAGGVIAAPAQRHVQVGTASYYGTQAAGKTTASGEKMSPSKLTAASKTLPLGTKAKVTNLRTGKSATVTVNDRGPYAGGRVIDVSPKAADRLDMKQDGVAPVAVKPLGKPGK